MRTIFKIIYFTVVIGGFINAPDQLLAAVQNNIPAIAVSSNSVTQNDIHVGRNIACEAMQSVQTGKAVNFYKDFVIGGCA
jgi:hypothetical protein